MRQGGGEQAGETESEGKACSRAEREGCGERITRASESRERCRVLKSLKEEAA